MVNNELILRIEKNIPSSSDFLNRNQRGQERISRRLKMKSLGTPSGPRE